MQMMIRGKVQTRRAEASLELLQEGVRGDALGPAEKQ
jgi:hypothetical protein